MIRKILAALLMVMCARTVLAAPADEAAVIFHPVSDGVGYLTTSEDASLLIALNAKKDGVKIFGVDAGNVAGKIDCPATNFVLQRGKSIFLATATGSINIYSAGPEWKLTGQIKLDAEPVTYLSAARGSSFDGTVLACTGTDLRKQHLWECNASKLSARRIEITEPFEVATVDRGGRTLMLQNYIEQNPGGIPSTYALSEVLRGNAKPMAKGAYGTYGFLYQTGGSDCWSEGAGMQVFGGNPPTRLFYRNNSYLVPDAARPITYNLELSRVTAISLQGKFDEGKTWNIHFENPKRQVHPHPPAGEKIDCAAVALTVGNKLVVYYRDDHDLYRGELPDAAPAQVAAAGGGAPSQTAEAPAEFTALATKSTASAMAITEDGKSIVLAHEKDNLISLWDVKTGKMLAEKACQSPGFVLCRGSRIFVSNYGKGTIDAFSAQLKLEDELLVGSANVGYLCAAQGEHFDGKLYAETDEGLFLIDSRRDEHQPLHKGWTPQMLMPNFTGDHLLTMNFGGDHLEAWTTASFMTASSGNSIPHSIEIYPYLYQVRADGLWFGGRGVYSGEVPEPLRRDMGIMVIPDRQAPLFYTLYPDRLSARRQNEAMASVGERPIAGPFWLAKYESRPEDEVRREIPQRRNPRWTGLRHQRAAEIVAVDQPIAVTLGDVLYLYLRDPDSGTVFRSQLPAFSSNASPVAATEPAGSHDGKMAEVPTDAPVTTMALSEDGSTLILAHEKENLLTIWDARRGNLLKRISSASPRSLLCRGGLLYVANYGKGTVTVMDPAKQWSSVTEIPVTFPEVFHLTAAHGAHFNNEIVATCGKPRDRHVVLVDTARRTASDLRARADIGAVTVDWDGRMLYEQKDFIPNAIGWCRGFDYAAYVHGRGVLISESQSRFRLLEQAHNSAMWYDGVTAAISNPPRIVLPMFPGGGARPDIHGLVVGDQNADLYYAVSQQSLVARSADAESAVVGKHAGTFPKWAALPGIMQGQSDGDIPQTPTDVFAPPIAFSAAVRLYLFAVHDHILYRYSGEAFSSTAVTPTAASTTQPSDFSQLFVTAEDPYLNRSRESGSIIYVEPQTIRIFSRDVTRASANLSAQSSYRKVLERKDYYLALAPTSLDLLDKASGRILKKIDIDGVTRDLTLRYDKPISYLSASDAQAVAVAGNQIFSLPRVYEVNEQTGSVRVLRHVYGEYLELSGDGRDLYAVVHSNNLPKDDPWELGPLSVALRGRFDALLRYSISGGGNVRFVQSRETGRLGTKQIVMSDDSSEIGDSSDTVTWKVSDLGAPLCNYACDGVDHYFDFSPTDPLVAAASRESLQIFDRNSGKVIKGAVDVDKAKLRKPFERAVFTSTGKSLMVIGVDAQSGKRVLRNVPLEAIAFAARPVEASIIGAVPSVYMPEQEPDAGTIVPVASLPGMKSAPAGKLNARQIVLKHSDAIVMVGGADPVFTGFLVGPSGYVVTCAKAVGGERRVWVRLKTAKGVDFEMVRSVELVRIDQQRDLALFRISGSDRPFLRLAAKAAEDGDPVTALSHSGAVRPFSDYTVSNGVVSGANRQINGVPYLQTNAPLTGASIGCPLFNEFGEVIGVVARRSRNENTSFAIPVSELRDFLQECTVAEPADLRPRPPATARPATPVARRPQPITPSRPAAFPTPLAQGEPLVVHQSPIVGAYGPTFVVAPDNRRYAWSRNNPAKKAAQFFVDGRPGSTFQMLGVLIFSPDSKHFSYSAGPREQDKPGVLVIDGREIPLPAKERFQKFQFTPDCKHVYFTMTDLQQSTTMLVIDGVAKKTHRGKLLNEPSFTPDGLHSTFALRNGNNCSLVKDDVETPLSNEGGFVTKAGHYLVTTGIGTEMRVFYDGKQQATSPLPGTSFEISDDGLHLIYAAVIPPGRYIVNIDGVEHDGDSPVITKGPFHFAYCTPEAVVIDGKPRSTNGHRPEAGRLYLAPGGKHVAYIYRTPENAPLVCLDGNIVTTSDGYPGNIEFSPDGEHLAFTLHDNNSRAWRMVVDGKVWPGQFSDLLKTTWSADGTHMAFTAMRHGSGIQETCYLVVDASEGEIAPARKSSPYFDAEGVHVLAENATTAFRIDAKIPVAAKK